MKFGRQLRHLTIEEWQRFYVRYNALKSILKKFAKHESTEERKIIHKEFFENLERDIDEVEKFYRSRVGFYASQLQKARLLFLSKDQEKSDSQRKKKLDGCSALLSHILHDLSLLNSFGEVNRVATRKILKKHDKTAQTKTQARVLELVSNERSFFSGELLAKLTQDAEAFLSTVTKYTIRQQFDRS